MEQSDINSDILDIIYNKKNVVTWQPIHETIYIERNPYEKSQQQQQQQIQ